MCEEKRSTVHLNCQKVVEIFKMITKMSENSVKTANKIVKSVKNLLVVKTADIFTKFIKNFMIFQTNFASFSPILIFFYM